MPLSEEALADDRRAGCSGERICDKPVCGNVFGGHVSSRSVPLFAAEQRSECVLAACVAGKLIP